MIRIVDKSISSDYLYQILSDDKFFDYNMQFAKGAKMPRGDKTKIMEYLIPIPQKQNMQDKIISVLNNFEKITNSITEGLPREIELRQKQYEYYRDMLLNFPKPTHSL